MICPSCVVVIIIGVIIVGIIDISIGTGIIGVIACTAVPVIVLLIETLYLAGTCTYFPNICI